MFQKYYVCVSGPGPIQSLSRVSTAEEVEKGNAVRNQLGRCYVMDL